MLLPKQFTEDSYITYFIYTLNIQVSHAGSILHWCSPFFDCNTTQFYRIWCSYLISYKYRFSSDCESLRLWQADTYLAARGAAVSSPGERPVSPLELTSGGLVFSWLFPGSGSLLLKRTSHSGGGSASLSLPPPSSSEHIHAPLWAPCLSVTSCFYCQLVTEPVIGQDPSLLGISDRLEILSQFIFSV